MDAELYNKLITITEEEQKILDGAANIDKDIYFTPWEQNEGPIGENYVVDAAKLMQKGRMIEIRRHIRFAHFPAHTHNYVELVYMYSGQSRHILNNEDLIELKQGELLFLNQHAVQEILPAGKEDIAVNFIILPQFFDRAIAMMGSNNILKEFLINSLTGKDAKTSYIHFKVSDILPIQNLMENMIWNLVEKKKQTNVINETTMGLVLMNLSSFAEEISDESFGGYEQQLVFACLKYIQEHYPYASLDELCSALGEQNYYISRILKKYTGSNFKELLQKRKLEQASYLLLNTTLTTARIMEEVGYDNSSYFHKKFKEYYGMTPKEYRC